MSNNNKHLFIALSIYLAGVVLLFEKFQFNINPDAISYFSISRKYFLSNYSEAINGYWGPLYSLLILPSFHFGIEPVVFARLTNIIFTFLLFVLIYYLSEILKLEKRIQILCRYFFIAPALYFTFWYVTPDYLLLFLFLMFILLAIDENYLLKFRVTLFASFIAALMYYTKSYGLAFFLVFQTIIFFIYYIRKSQFRKKIIFNYVISIVFFFVLISPWVYLISNKYGYFTVSTSGKINLLIVNPELNFHHPPIENGLISPSDKYDVSIWDDPDVKLYPDWSPFKSFSDFKHFSFNFLKNLAKFLLMLFLFSPIGIISIYFLRKEVFKDFKVLLIILALVIYGLGYCFIYVESRYIWASLVLFAIVSFIPLKTFAETYRQKKILHYLLAILISVSSIPFIFLAYRNYTYDNRAYQYSKELQKKFELKGNIASTSNWGFSHSLAYFLDSKYFGEEKLTIPDSAFISKLKNFNIDYMFHYGELNKEIEGLKFLTKIDSLSVFTILK
ncbi:hypothetical protein [Ignavibacterium sp.]|uniref:hypothetical protein n=1 Tax=Ignavibacterium sp. TaxID=2651167 RepID=UPI00307DB558